MLSKTNKKKTTAKNKEKEKKKIRLKEEVIERELASSSLNIQHRKITIFN